MIKASMTAAALVTSMVWVAAAPAQVDPAAKKILEDSAAALGKLTSIEYSARRYGTGQISLIDFSGDAKVILAAKDKTRCPMWMKGSSKSLGPTPDAFWYTVDGLGKMTVVDDANKMIYRDRPLDQRVPAMNQKSQGDQILVDIFFVPNPFDNEKTADQVELLPAADVRGEKCDVVRSSRPLRGGQGKSLITWYISSADKLPRKQEQSVMMGDQPINMIVELWNFKANTSLKPADIRIETPAGYKEDVFVAPAAPTPQPVQPDMPQVPVPPPTLGVEKGNVPPDFSLKTSDGKPVKRDDLKGSVAVLAFLWSKNAPSAKAIPILEELNGKFKDKGVKVYAITSHEKAEADGPKFLADNKATFGALVGGGDELNTAYKLKGFPSFYVIGADGKVAEFHQGFPGEEALKEKLNRAVEAATAAK